jgi:dienelactone hydrolase
MLARPTLANIRAVDFVHLIGTGMCFGGAIVALVWARSQ